MKFRQHKAYLIWNGKQENIFGNFVQRGFIEPGCKIEFRDAITEDPICLVVDGWANIFVNLLLRIQCRFAMTEKAADRVSKFYSSDDNLKSLSKFCVQQIGEEAGKVQ